LVGTGLLACRLGYGEHGGGFAEKLFGTAGFGEDVRALRHASDLLANGAEVRVEAGEYEDGAVRALQGDSFHEVEAGATGHGDIAEHELGVKGACTLKCFIDRVADLGVEAVFSEDDAERIRGESFVVDD